MRIGDITDDSETQYENAPELKSVTMSYVNKNGLSEMAVYGGEYVSIDFEFAGIADETSSLVVNVQYTDPDGNEVSDTVTVPTESYEETGEYTFYATLGYQVPDDLTPGTEITLQISWNTSIMQQ